MNVFLRPSLLFVVVLICSKGECTSVPRWLSNFSLSVGHGLNYHLDGNKTIYWDDIGQNYEINNSTSFEVFFHSKRKLSISCFRERTSAVYQDSISILRDDLIFQRVHVNIGISFSYDFDISKRLSITPRLGVMRRKGFELYAFHAIIRPQFRTIELSDLGLTSGLSFNYLVGKGVSVFAMVDYTRFVYLKSDKLGEREFYDGPTVNYIRTRIGLQYSFSHLFQKKSNNLNDPIIK